MRFIAAAAVAAALFPFASTPLHMVLLALCISSLLACAWVVAHWTGDDDDEMYFAMFRPEASPVATPHAFAKIIERLPRGSHILDIGVGSATYLEFDRVRSLLRERKLHVVGVDISEPNVEICKARIKKHNLEDCFEAYTRDVCDLSAKDGQYDAVLFMESFPCMSVGLFDKLLQHARTNCLAPSGTIYLYHNLMDRSKASFATELGGRITKPRFKYFLGIDFGRLTTIQQMDRILKESMPTADVRTEVLLSANARDVSVNFDNVSDRWHATCGRLFLGLSHALGTQMEQHLVTITVPK